MKRKVLTFYLDNNLFGIDSTLVKEINRNVEYTSVPGSPPFIVGLFNMRGQVVTLFNLAKLAGYEEKTWGQVVTCIILKAPPNDPNQVGFLIDKPGDVIDIDEELAEPPPANVEGIEGEILDSVVKLKDEILLIIKSQKLFKV